MKRVEGHAAHKRLGRNDGGGGGTLYASGENLRCSGVLKAYSQMRVKGSQIAAQCKDGWHRGVEAVVYELEELLMGPVCHAGYAEGVNEEDFRL